MVKKKNCKWVNSVLQNTTQKTKDRATRSPLKTGDEVGFSGRVGSSCSACDTHRLDYGLAKKVAKHNPS